MKHIRYILILALTAVLSLDAAAQVDKKDVRRGNRDFRKGEFSGAVIDYMKALQKDSLSVAANYNLANAYYREGDMQNAKAALERIKDVVGMSHAAADYYYNLGDVAIALEDWQGAVDDFMKSLLLNPGDVDAKENFIYARMKLQNQQQNQQNDQNQDQNDQNQDQNDQNQDQNDQNQDQNQNQDDQNKNDQDQNQDKNDQSQDQDQNQQQNQDQQQDQQQTQGQQPKITPQAAQQMLQAIQAKEKETQEKVNRQKAEALKSRQKDKNW